MNTLTVIIITSLLILIMGFYKRKKEKSKTRPENLQEKEIVEYNKEFLDNADGREAIPFVRIFAQTDKLLLRSILSSEGICTYMTNEMTNSLFPGRMIQGYTDMVIYVFKDDKEKARPIVEEYILNLVENVNPEIRAKAVDYIAVMALLPTSLNQIIPEIID